MAERRMFAKSIVLSDAFLDMPMSARCLYFTLVMFADDDGFVGSPKGIMRQCGASQDDMAILLQKRFVLGFECGVIVVKHWRINNYLQKDRYKPTTYLEELATLTIDDKGAYVEKERENTCLYGMDTKCIQDVSNLYTQDSIGKESIVEDSIGEVREGKDRGTGEGADTPSPPSKKAYGTYHNVLLTDEEYAKLQGEYKDYSAKIERLSSYIATSGKTYANHYATIRTWAKQDADKNKAKAPRDRSYTDADVKAYEAWGQQQVKGA